MTNQNTDTSSDSSTDKPGDSETTSTSTRWRFTNDVLAILLVAGTLYMAVYGFATGKELPSTLTWVLATEALLASAWAFGPRAVESVNKLRSAKREPAPRSRQPAASRRSASTSTSDQGASESSDSEVVK